MSSPKNSAPINPPTAPYRPNNTGLGKPANIFGAGMDESPGQNV